MKLYELSANQRDNICRYLHIQHGTEHSCSHCPFAISDGYGTESCGEFLFDEEIPDELNKVAKLRVYAYSKQKAKEKDTKK